MLCLLGCTFPSKGLVKKTKRLTPDLGWLSDSIRKEFKYQAATKSVDHINSPAVRDYLKKRGFSNVTLQYALPDSSAHKVKFAVPDLAWYDSTLSFGKIVDYGDSTIHEYIIYDQTTNPRNFKKSKWDMLQCYWMNDSIRLERHAFYLIIVH